MEKIITEKTYPIRIIWFFKSFLFIIIAGPALLFIFLQLGGTSHSDMLLYLIPFALISSVSFLGWLGVSYIQVSSFHYSLESHSIVLEQGVISKQSKTISYTTIKNIKLSQLSSDKIFGLASITIEDSSEKSSAMDEDGIVYIPRPRHSSQYESVGFVGNRVHITGLKKAEAYKLQEIILQKIKEESTKTR